MVCIIDTYYPIAFSLWKLVSHYRFIQMVKFLTRGDSILDKIWTNMAELYNSPLSISELGKSDHNSHHQVDGYK